MNIKWIGAILIIAGCGGTGFSISSACRKEEKQLRELLAVVQHMKSELEFMLPPLPDLMKHAMIETTGGLRYVLESFVKELTRLEAPDATACMLEAITHSAGLSPKIRRLLKQLGNSIGCFDLSGQLRGLRGVQARCEEELNSSRENRDLRLRSYQTLGLCAGTALAILFI